MNKKLTMPIIAGAIISSSILPFFGTEADAASNINTQSTLNEKVNANIYSQNISADLISKADQFITISSDKSFVLNLEKAKSILSKEEIEIVQNRLSETNQLSEENRSNLVVIGDHLATKVSKTDMQKATSEGINKVEGYWWGLKIWLSKTTVRKIMNVGAQGGAAYVAALVGGYIGSKGGAHGAIVGAVAGAVAGAIVSEFITPTAARAVFMTYNYAFGIDSFQIFNK